VRPLVLGLLAALWCAAAWAQPLAAPETSRPSGRDIYFGLGVKTPSCASCHGVAGAGGGEGGAVIPGLAGQVGPTGAYRGVGNLCRAVTRGIGADGRILARAMPRIALDDRSCADLWRYLAVRERRPLRGVTADKITIRLDGPAASPALARWRAVFRDRFAAVNSAGGIYGRRLELSEHGASLMAVILAEDNARDDAEIRIRLREHSRDPARRGIESPADAEALGILKHVAGTPGLTSVRWIDERNLGPSPEQIALLAVGEGLAVLPTTPCSANSAVATVILSLAGTDPTCPKAGPVYVALRGAPLAMVARMATDGVAALIVVSPIPYDALAGSAPLTLAEIVIDTVRQMTAAPTEARLLEALQRSWSLRAQTSRTLYSGAALQPLSGKDLQPTADPVWIDAPPIDGGA